MNETQQPKRNKTLKKHAPGVWSRSDGTWVMRATANHKGATVLDVKLTFPPTWSLGQVVDERARLLREARDGEGPGVQIPTFLTFAASWLDRLKARGRRTLTLQSYATALQLHVVPALGHLPLDQITKLDLVKLSDALCVKRKENGEPYSQQTVARIWSKALSVLRAGLDLYDLRDVSRGVPGPERTESRKAKGRALSPGELGALLAYLREHCHLWLLFTLLAATGMRQGEGRKLERSRVDLDKAQIRLRADDTKGKYARIVPIPAWLVALLREHIAQQLKTGCLNLKAGRLFGTKRGTTLASSTITQTLMQHAASGGFGHVTPHDLRRSFISACVDRGVNEHLLREVVGHCGAQMTRLYYRSREEERRAVVEGQLWDSALGLSTQEGST